MDDSGQARSTMSMSAENYFGAQDSILDANADITPERNLWVAVILSLLADYQDAVLQATAAVRRGTPGAPTNIAIKWRIECLRREAANEWIQEICSHVSVANYHILKRFDAIDQEFNLKAVQWTTRAELEFSKPAASLRGAQRISREQ